MKKSIGEGYQCTIPTANTMADGVAVKCPGAMTFAHVQKYVDDIVTVSEDEIISTILRLLEEGKVTAEGAGASSVAAVINEKYDFKGEKVCAVLSGGNINVNTISRIITNGLFDSGRLMEISTLVPDKPGELIRLLEIIKEKGANILTIDQYSSSESMNLDRAVVRIVLETFNEEHKKDIYDTLFEAGYREAHQ